MTTTMLDCLDPRGSSALLLTTKSRKAQGEALDNAVNGIPNNGVAKPETPLAPAMASTLYDKDKGDAQEVNGTSSPTSVANGERTNNGVNGHGQTCLNGATTTGSSSSSHLACTVPPKFSSDTEEPIVMSPDAMASLLQHVHFTETDDDIIMPIPSPAGFGSLILQPTLTTSKTHLKVPFSSSLSLLQYFFSSAWDTCYSTSALTRPVHYHNLQHWAGLVLADMLAKLTLQRPFFFQSPLLVQRILSLLWHRGPMAIHHTTADSSSSAAFMSSLTFQQLPMTRNQIFSGTIKSTTPAFVQGIPNYGQTCFLNVVLQSLASLDSVLAYTQWIAMEQQQQQQHSPVPSRKHRHFSRKPTPTATTTVSQLLLPLLQSLNGQEPTTTTKRHRAIDPRELLWRIAQKNSQFQAKRHGLFGFTSPATHSTGGEQQDAQELLQALLEMMIVDAKLEEPLGTSSQTNNSHQPNAYDADSDDDNNEGFTNNLSNNISMVKTPSQMSGMSLSSMLFSSTHSLEEKSDEEFILPDNMEDEVLTLLSDRWVSPRTSSNNSLCGGAEEQSQQQQLGTAVQNGAVPDTIGTGNFVTSTSKVSSNPDTNSIWTHVQMVDSTGIMSSYQDGKKQQPQTMRSSFDENHNTSSLASSFLSTTSTVITSNSQDPPLSQPQQSSTALSASMKIMLSTISSITKTPLSCWTGSLVQCQACRHTRAVRNQEWREIPIVPSALRNPAMLMSQSTQALPPCRLQECLQTFTQVERVTGVECGNCTLQRDIDYWQGEVDILRGAVESLERRSTTKKNNVGSSNSDGQVAQGEQLRLELAEAELKLRSLMQQDPDEYDPRLTSDGHGESRNSNLTMLKADALKCLVLTRLPSVLCLHVQRRYYDQSSERMRKTLQHVVFDEILDLAPYCAYGGGNANAREFFAANCPPYQQQRQPQQCASSPILYRLTSIIEHLGDAYGGHYVCYRRLPAHLESSGNAEKKWYYCSDDAIRPVSWEQVRRAQPYMLFYEAM